jgi:REP element-mobilizing transposase RayT
LWQSEIARCVMDCLREKAGSEHDLHAFVVMSNHVHILITPRVPLASITKAMKGRSARPASAILGRTGQPFWQDESFDHWIRHPRQFGEGEDLHRAESSSSRLGAEAGSMAVLQCVPHTG